MPDHVKKDTQLSLFGIQAIKRHRTSPKRGEATKQTRSTRVGISRPRKQIRIILTTSRTQTRRKQD